jgi:uncharacterized damage-inducible protein DinB
MGRAGVPLSKIIRGAGVRAGSIFPAMTNAIAEEFRRQIVRRLGESRQRLEKCVGELTEEEIWRRPNPASNSVGNLLLHLRGNLTQWVLCGVGGAEDRRERDAEFAARGGRGKDELLAGLLAVIDAAAGWAAGAGEGELLRIRPVQGYRVSGIDIFVHVTEHLSYHTGQIAFWTKLLKDKDLGFYAGADLNRRGGPPSA